MKRSTLLITTLLLNLLVITGCSSNKQPATDLPELEQTGPIWGDGAEAKEEYMDVARVSPSQPTAMGEIYYSAIPPEGTVVDNPAFAQGRISVTILDRYGKKIPVIQSGGNYYIKGIKGESYTLYFENISNTGYEVLATTDGVDSITGREGHYNNAGYILFPGNTITVKGFRQTREEYKPFIFHEKDSPYLKGANEGSAANIGVIGFALFELATPKMAKDAKPKAFPAQTNKFRLDK